MLRKTSITDVPGVKVGHYTDESGVTGCTVVLCEDGAVGGVDVRGSAPGTRETDLLRSGNLVERLHAVLLSGGSSFGLDAAGGVMRYLEERHIGFPVGTARIPIVSAAVIFDLGIGSATARPSPKDGYRACREASAAMIEEGSVGAGTGATVGKALGRKRAVKGGIGTASRRLSRGTVVGALAVVNALGDVVEPTTGEKVAGPRRADGAGFEDTVALMASGRWTRRVRGANTTLAIVATDAPLTKDQANKLAQMAQDGIARAIRPAHTMYDGDVVFALATGTSPAHSEVTALGAVAAEVVAEACVRGVQRAGGLAGVPAVSELVA
ncbi:MAG: P1 family peptidase [Chloroflexi bacterium]|nr:P1 family peptidase [Chloroflexota bacterium]